MDVMAAKSNIIQFNVSLKLPLPGLCCAEKGPDVMYWYNRPMGDV